MRVVGCEDGDVRGWGVRKVGCQGMKCLKREL